MEIQNPHDKFFKESMGNAEVAKDFLANYLPKSVLQIIDLNFSHRYPIPCNFHTDTSSTTYCNFPAVSK
ncbi:Rpn family recombination-promoting nuclease/putative transposase [Sporosarcina newyorkensis]|uniref:Putative transposase, YhgA-like n=1 Tax=Sporosarcina newyorkensis TaxID=759851 RepID=A0A1T4YI35_9BACL|nr:Rpn family recombination-promoting nuclease/putative transposase [Sporosarcina newyorkensis]SKB01330.1 Putative transposase, YhgA-like [Sporosarcina newyorkensis]